MPTREKALAGRRQALRIAPTHYVTGRAIRPDGLVTDPAVRPDGLSGGAGKPDTAGLDEIHFGMGCFWGAEKMFWTIPGVLVTSVGYAGGFTPNATYEEVCSGQTGHTEVVRVVYDPAKVSLDELLRVFWEGHDPTQGMRQGGDIGTQYRSTIYFNTPAQEAAARASLEAYQQRLSAAGYGKITTEIAPAGPFYFAEDYHQQYLAKNPNGYCGHGGTGVSCPIGIADLKTAD